MIDTAGRLHIDDDPMVELERSRPRPSRRGFVCRDAMTGRMLQIGRGFHERVGITGVV